jgi:hypothetical protein
MQDRADDTSDTTEADDMLDSAEDNMPDREALKRCCPADTVSILM